MPVSSNNAPAVKLPGSGLNGITSGSSSDMDLPYSEFRDMGIGSYGPDVPHSAASLTSYYSRRIPSLSDLPSSSQVFSDNDDALMNYWTGLFSSVGEQNELNRLYNAEQAQLNRDFNAAEAQKAREWSEYMSSSSYQRAVADLQKAGLNPILAYQQGGASTPSSSSASGQSASYNVGGGDTFTDLLQAFAHLISSSSSIIDAITPDINILKKI